MWFYMKYIS